MFHRISYRAWLALSGLAVSLSSARAQAPLAINGVVDRGDYADSVTLSVPAASGYTYSARLDGKPIPLDVNVVVTNVDYHQLSVFRTNLSTLAITNREIGFVVHGSIYGTTERGIPAWTPYPVINATAAELASAQLRVIVPQDFPMGLEIPVVAWIEKEDGAAVRANALLTAPGQPSMQLFRGAGSGFLAATNPAGLLSYSPAVPGIQTNKAIQIESSTTWTTVSGTLPGVVNWPPNSRIAVNGNVTIPSGSVLNIGEGTVVRLNLGVNITNNGHILINGTEQQPVVFTPVTRAQPWGGFYMRTNTGAIEANGAIFVGSGANPNGGAGHRPEQCLFFLDHRPRLALTNCAAIYMAGQFGHASAGSTNASDPAWTVVNVVHTLVQRCITGGEWNGCELKLLDSAIIEVPFATPDFADLDEDAIYFTSGEFEVRNTLIGWSRDDGIDAGSNDGGSVTVSNGWHESSFHEAFAWSGGGGSPGLRRTTNIHCVAINCGQGYECGWSRGNVSPSPNVFVTDSLGVGNSIGTRFGDNYTPAEGFVYYGFLRVTNSILLNNIRDVWGYNWEDWTYRTSVMDIRGNALTMPNTNHPNNQIWNPATDGWRLASFMSTPPDAPVGIGFAMWTNQFRMSSIFDGVPVGLSCFTTNFVSVGYTFAASGGAPLAQGTLTFAPGETVKRIYPAGFDLVGINALDLVLSNPVRAELTGITNVTFQGTYPATQIYCWVNGAQADLARVLEGVPVALTARSALPVSVDYKFESNAGTVASGTLTFQPGETLAWAVAPGVNAFAYDVLRLTLSNAVSASLGTPVVVYFFPLSTVQPPSGVTLVARGSVWKYLSNGGDQGTNWQALSFNDSGWAMGPAELGYGDMDEATIIPSAQQPTVYFRHQFTSPDPSQFSNLSMWLKRDDGGVVHLNAKEIFRSPNMPAGTIRYTNLTLGATAENAIDTATIGTNFLKSGPNIVAVEIHQQALTSSDISFDFELIGNPAPASPRLEALRFADGLLLYWNDPTFALEQSSQLPGSWTTVVGSSPVFVTPIATTFYRLRK
jgi:hypothetical protein